MTPAPQKEYIITEDDIDKVEALSKSGYDRTNQIINILHCRPYTSASSDKIQQLLKTIDRECKGVEECVLRSDAKNMAKNIRYYIQASELLLQQTKEREQR